MSCLPFCPACGKDNVAGAAFCVTCGKPLTASVAALSFGLTPSAPAPGGHVHAEIVDRFVAALIDGVILFVVALVIGLPLGIILFLSFGIFTHPIIGIFLILSILYFTYFEGTTGQTLGKQIAKIKVVDARTAAAVSMERAFIRSLLRVMDWLPFLYINGGLLILLQPSRQRLGDLAAFTVVIRV